MLLLSNNLLISCKLKSLIYCLNFEYICFLSYFIFKEFYLSLI